jgi:putative transposase
MIEKDNQAVTLKVQAELLNLNRTSLYYQPLGPSPTEIATKRRIDELYTAHPFYGSRKITALLNQEQSAISRPTVQRYMREMGIAGITPGPNLSKAALQHKHYPYLLRGLTIDRPNQVWGIDITYIRLLTGWMYLVAVLDWFSRYVVSWALDPTLEIDFVLQAVDQALLLAKPDIWNSDQGSHFTSPQYLDRLKAAQVRISMDGRGRALDNIFTERLWRSLKYEEVYLNEYDSVSAATAGIRQYFTLYNTRRPHSSLTDRTPDEVYFSPLSLPAAA